jgi:hypothetical protein
VSHHAARSRDGGRARAFPAASSRATPRPGSRACGDIRSRLWRQPDRDRAGIKARGEGEARAFASLSKQAGAQGQAQAGGPTSSCVAYVRLGEGWYRDLVVSVTTRSIAHRADACPR